MYAGMINSHAGEVRAAIMPGQTRSYKWFVVGMLWLVCFFNYADRQAVFSVFPLIGRRFALTPVQLGVIGSSFMWMYALFGPLAGWLCDRFPRKTLILGALLFWSAATGATALSNRYWQLVLFRALGGLGEAFYFPASMSLISDYHRETRSRAMAIHQSSVYAGTIAGGTVSGILGQYYGWQSSFIVLGACGLLLALALGPLLRESPRGMADSDSLPESSAASTPQRRPGLRATIGELFSNRMVLLLTFVFICANFVAVIFLTWMPTFLYQKFRMSLSLAGFSATAYLQAGSVLGVVAGGFLGDGLVQCGGKWQHTGRMFAQSIALFCGAPFLFLTGATLSVQVLIIAMTGFGFFKGMYDANIFASLYDVVRPEHHGIAVGIMNSLAWLGGSFAPVAFAICAHQYGMSVGISATAAIYLLMGVLMFWGRSALLTQP